jgi:hypothetical protein
VKYNGLHCCAASFSVKTVPFLKTFIYLDNRSASVEGCKITPAYVFVSKELKQLLCTKLLTLRDYNFEGIIHYRLSVLLEGSTRTSHAVVICHGSSVLAYRNNIMSAALRKHKT